MPQSTPSNPVLNQFVERARNLHSLPAVAVKILELTNDPKIDLRAVKDCIETDPALTGKILKTVNGSLFGLSREVSDLNQALALLGTTPLKMLVLGSKTNTIPCRPTAAAAFPVQRWRIRGPPQ